MDTIVWLQSPIVLTLTRYILVLVFLVSAAGKLRNQPAFVAIVTDYRVLPSVWARRFARTLPWLELLAALLLSIGLWIRFAALLSGVMLISFTYAVGLNLVRGRTNVSCGCVGAKKSGKIRASILFRNAILLLFSLQQFLWGQEASIAVTLVAWATSFLFRQLIVFGGGMPLTFSISGLMMLALLRQQLLRFAHLEIKK